MPIGLVSDDLLALELSRLTPLTSQVQKPIVVHTEPVVDAVVENLPPSRGRARGDVNVPDSLRQIIGETAVIDGRQAALNLAKEFGISNSSVSAYAKGATSTASYNAPAKSIIQHINKSRRRSIKRASAVLNDALGAITQDKLDYTDAKDLSAIAKDMSVVIKNLEPPAESSNGEDAKSQPQFVVYAPTFRDERSFDTITVTE